MPIRRINQAQLAALTRPLLLDVREPAEFDGARMPNSFNLPLSKLGAGIEQVPKDQPIVVICQSGRRSEDAARKLSAAGITDVFILEDGSWAAGHRRTGPGLDSPPGVHALERLCRPRLDVLGGHRYLRHGDGPRAHAVEPPSVATCWAASFWERTWASDSSPTKPASSSSPRSA